MGPDLQLRKEPDHQFMEFSPEPVNTATDMKARKMVVFSFCMYLNIYLKHWPLLLTLKYFWHF